MIAARTTSIHSKTRDTSARESIFASIRQNLAASAPFNDAHLKHHENPIERQLIDRSPISRIQLIDNFKTNLASVGGHCSIVADQSDAAEVVRAAIESLGAAKIAVSDSDMVGSIAEKISGVAIVKDADRDYLFASDVGITSAQWAIAETGTLVLGSNAERHRLTSLVPPVHICILEADKMRQSLGEILELINTDLTRVVTFITGASRTSDIELTLAIGVHGPRELHVVIINDQE